MSIRRLSSASHSRAVSSPARETSAIGTPESPFAPLSIRAPHAYPPQPRSVALSYTSRPRYPPHSPAPRTSGSSVALVVHDPSSRVRTTSACPSVDDHFKAARQCDQLDVQDITPQSPSFADVLTFAGARCWRFIKSHLCC
ncbi:hypothetical protein VTO73DRAFT_6200 [Trametes versicolor]